MKDDYTKAGSSEHSRAAAHEDITAAMAFTRTVKAQDRPKINK